MEILTCTAPVNIAVIKYWGKRDEKLILPINDSISVTLSSDQMNAKTTVARSKTFTSDQIWLNGKEENMSNPRLLNCLREIRIRGNLDPDEHIHICSENNFPTAAGLASSAAGYACLVYALCKLCKVEGDFSQIARQGSGSACRSIYGGFVQWHMGSDPSGKDSMASVVKEAEHWSDLRVLILVVSDERKKVPSSEGMKRSIETSPLIHQRAQVVVPQRIQLMRKAIENKDFDSFGRLSMEDSNNMHAICLDTYPPCVYMNQTSHQIVRLVHQINHFADSIKVCYTFDAGPNACLFLPEKYLAEVAGYINHFFPPPSNQDDYFRGEPIQLQSPSQGNVMNLDVEVQPKASLRYVISTKVGSGPKVLPASGNEDPIHLLNSEGVPKNMAI